MIPGLAKGWGVSVEKVDRIKTGGGWVETRKLVGMGRLLCNAETQSRL